MWIRNGSDYVPDGLFEDISTYSNQNYNSNYLWRWLSLWYYLSYELTCGTGKEEQLMQDTTPSGLEMLAHNIPYLLMATRVMLEIHWLIKMEWSLLLLIEIMIFGVETVLLLILDRGGIEAATTLTSMVPTLPLLQYHILKVWSGITWRTVMNTQWKEQKWRSDQGNVKKRVQLHAYRQY